MSYDLRLCRFPYYQRSLSFLVCPQVITCTCDASCARLGVAVLAGVIIVIVLIVPLAVMQP